jgi:hypothetical protein
MPRPDDRPWEAPSHGTSHPGRCHRPSSRELGGVSGELVRGRRGYRPSHRNLARRGEGEGGVARSVDPEARLLADKGLTLSVPEGFEKSCTV